MPNKPLCGDATVLPVGGHSCSWGVCVFFACSLLCPLLHREAPGKPFCQKLAGLFPEEFLRSPA